MSIYCSAATEFATSLPRLRDSTRSGSGLLPVLHVHCRLCRCPRRRDLQSCFVQARAAEALGVRTGSQFSVCTKHINIHTHTSVSPSLERPLSESIADDVRAQYPYPNSIGSELEDLKLRMCITSFHHLNLQCGANMGINTHVCRHTYWH